MYVREFSINNVRYHVWRSSLQVQNVMGYYTVDTEIFAVLNIHSFNCIEVLQKYFHFLGQKCLLFSLIKEGCLYSWKKIHSTLKAMKTIKAYPRKSFHVYSISMNNWTQIYMLHLISCIKDFNMFDNYLWLLAIILMCLVIPLQLDTPSLS